MNCTTCDTPLEPGALFCANCGARVTPASSAATPTIVLPGAGPSSSPPPYSQTDGGPYSPPAPLPYAPPQPAYAPATAPNSTAAVISLVFGILSWVGLVLIGAIVAVVAGHMARNEIRNSGGRIGGGGMALAGLILGYAHLALLLLGCVVLAVLLVIGSATSR